MMAHKKILVTGIFKIFSNYKTVARVTVASLLVARIRHPEKRRRSVVQDLLQHFVYQLL